MRFHRIGIVIATLHDISDPLMEFAKLLLYSGYQKVEFRLIQCADIFFGIFAATFVFTRNYIFPVYVINSIRKYADYEYQTKTIYTLFFVALWILELLHLYWAALVLIFFNQILRMAKSQLIDQKGLKDDIRNKDANQNKELLK